MSLPLTTLSRYQPFIQSVLCIISDDYTEMRLHDCYEYEANKAPLMILQIHNIS